MPDRSVRTRRPLSRTKKLCFSAVTIVGLLGALELAARMVVPPPDVLVHQEHEALITVGGLPALNDTMEFDPDLFWRLKADLDKFPVAGANGRYRIDFDVTTNHRHLRTGPVAERKQRLRVLALGDSCAFGVGVEDDETWPRALEDSLAAEHDVRVINAGVPGYTAYQGMRFLKKNLAELQPDVVICCFGFNDQCTWASRSDLETATMVQRYGWQSALTQHSRLYLGLQQAWTGVSSEPRTAAPRPRLLPIEYLLLLYRIEMLCDAQDADLILMIWPFAGQVKAREEGLGPYQTLTRRLGAYHNLPVVNLVPEFISEQQPLYVDHIHANAEGCRVAATALAGVVGPILDDISQ